MIGVVHLPSRQGSRMWVDWDPDALARDLHDIAAAGLSTVRLFLLWRDVEPEPGEHSAVVLGRLRQAVELAAAAGLSTVVSLLTVWLNGQRLDLPWRAGRNLWTDPEMLARQEDLARAVGTTLSGVDGLLAVDLGDEIGNVDPDARPTRAEVAAWRTRLAGVLRAHLPGVAVMQATDASGVLGGSPFGIDDGAALDLLAVHGFPTWAPGSIESTRSYKATSLTPFLVRYAAAYGVPYVDELAAYGVDEETSAGYLGAAAAAAVANGAAGVLAWCWQDVASTDEPYADRPAERLMGLRRLDGSAKPALGALSRVAAAAPLLAPGGEPAPVAVYLPERVRAAASSYLDPGVGTVATFYAYLLAKRAHLDVELVAGDPAGHRLVLVPSVTQVTAADLDRLRAVLAAGGTVWYSLGDHLHGFPGTDLAGVEPVDFDLLPGGKAELDWAGRWPLEWPGRSVTVRAAGAEVLGTFADGTPAVTAHRVGPGRLVFCAAPLERQLDRPGRLEAWAWERLYGMLAEEAGVAPVATGVPPQVEVVRDRRRTVLVNHGAEPVEVGPVRLAAKGWSVEEAG